jgi:hypothetical protein
MATVSLHWPHFLCTRQSSADRGQGFEEPGHVAASIQTFLRIGTVGTIYGGLAIFSCIAGVMLWMENPRGVSVAKAYFLVAAVLPILLYSALRFAGMEVDLLRIVLGRLASSAMWYAYLSSSRGVKLTYGAT